MKERLLQMVRRGPASIVNDGSHFGKMALLTLNASQVLCQPQQEGSVKAAGRYWLGDEVAMRWMWQDTDRAVNGFGHPHSALHLDALHTSQRAVLK